MPFLIDGHTYLSAAEVSAQAGVTRQTLWRWRQEGKVPVGRRFRDKQILFTQNELEKVLDYANRMEPVMKESARRSTGVPDRHR